MDDKFFEDWAKATFGNNTIDDTPRWKALPYLVELKQAWKAGYQMGCDCSICKEIERLQKDVEELKEVLRDIADGNGDTCSDCKYNTRVALQVLES